MSALSVINLFVYVTNVIARLMIASPFHVAKVRAKIISVITAGTNFTQKGE